MGLETASFINDLVVTNPTATETKSQGDDHLRVIKTALKGSFPTSTKAWYNPSTAAKVISFTVVAADMNKTFLVDTTLGTVTATLPTLVSGDAGWECFFIKTNAGTSPIFIAPASGTVQSGDLSALTKTRRCVPGVKCSAYWTGTAWFVSRSVNMPVGAIVPFDGTSLPVGFEWPNGQTLSGSSGSDYPDFFARTATLVVKDMKGRFIAGKDDMGGSAASRITTGGKAGINGASHGATGGEQDHTLTAAESAVLTYTFAGDAHHHSYDDNTTAGGGGGVAVGAGATNSTVSRTSGDTTATGTVTANGGGGAHNNLPPTIIMNEILVVE
jgi:hypothetical protein